MFTPHYFSNRAFHRCGLHCTAYRCQMCQRLCHQSKCRLILSNSARVGIPGGCEATVYATRQYIKAIPDRYVLAKIDFTNAFHRLHRDLVLRSVAEKVPSIYRFCHLAYSQRLSWSMRSELFSHKRDHIKAIHWVPFCSACPSIPI